LTLAGHVDAFPLDELKRQVNTLKLPHQDFTWGISHTALTTSPTLSNGVAAAMRMLPTDVTGTKPSRMFLDSHELEAQLHVEVSEKLQRKNSKALVHVPIVILLLEREHPVLVDGHYMARATNNLVIAVHNEQVRAPLNLLDWLSYPGV
jgi:hypothetical protein